MPPMVSLEDWRLRIAGPGVRHPREYTHDELKRKFEIVEVAAVNQCSGNRRGLFSPHVPGVQWGYGAMGNATWRGVRLKDVLESASLTTSALEVVANGADVGVLTAPDYIKSLPMWKVIGDDTLIAYWVKALVDLQVSDKPFDGFWMKTGYRVPKGVFGPSGFDSQDTAQNSPITIIKVNSLIVDPSPGARLMRGRVARIQGVAWDGGSGIRRVEISLDGGTNWRDSTLGADLGRYAWQPWHFEFTPQTAGVQSFMVRALARDGSTQPKALIHNPAGYHHNVIQKVDFDVA
jgi:hypothetical protein